MSMVIVRLLHSCCGSFDIGTVCNLLLPCLIFAPSVHLIRGLIRECVRLVLHLLRATLFVRSIMHRVAISDGAACAQPFIVCSLKNQFKQFIDLSGKPDASLETTMYLVRFCLKKCFRFTRASVIAIIHKPFLNLVLQPSTFCDIIGHIRFFYSCCGSSLRVACCCRACLWHQLCNSFES